LIYGHFAGTP